MRVVFTVEPESTAAALGSDLVLSCSAVALDVGGHRLRSASMNYSWTVDGHALPHKALYFFNHSLYVPAVTAADAGLYRCHVDYNSSTFSSRSATVVIPCNTTGTVFVVIVEYSTPNCNVHPRCLPTVNSASYPQPDGIRSRLSSLVSSVGCGVKT